MGIVYQPSFPIPIAYTPVYRGSNQSNVTIVYCNYWKNGQFLELDFHFEFTGQVDATGSPWYIELPVIGSQLNYDTTNSRGGTSSITNAGRGHVGHCVWFQAGTAWKVIHACMDDSSGGNVYRIRFAEGPGYVTMNQLTATGGNNSSIKACFIRIPIVGW